MSFERKNHIGCCNELKFSSEPSADVSHTYLARSRIPPNIYAAVNMPGKWIENSSFENNIPEEEESWLESAPRMTIDGTCAPPRMDSLNRSGECLCITPPKTPLKFYYARMSTGGRAPPKSPSPLKESLFIAEERPTSRPAVVRAEMESRVWAKTPDRPLLLKPHTATKKPRGRPRKLGGSSEKPRKHLEVSVKRPRERSKGRDPNSLAIASEATAKRGQGRPKERPSNNLGIVSEVTMKRGQGRLKGRPSNSSTIVSEVTTKRGRGRPRGSKNKKAPISAGVVPTTTEGVSNVSSTSSSPLVLLDRYTPETVTSKAAAESVKGTLAGKNGLKRRGRPRKSVIEKEKPL